MKTILRHILVLITLFAPLVSCGQYGNRFVLGFSSAGSFFSDPSDVDNIKRQLYIEMIPFIGIRCKENVYLYAELGRSFSNSQGLPEIPNYNFAGAFTRWYMIKRNIFDVYSGFGLLFSDLMYMDGNSFKTKSLNNVRYALYAGLSIKLIKQLHLATDVGYRYQNGINSIFHSKITLQYGF